MADKKLLSLKIPLNIYDQLDNYVTRTGITKTEVVANALAQYLGCADNVPLLHPMAHLEAGLAALEALQQ